MAHRKNPAPANPLKDENQSKSSTKALADRAPVGPGRPEAAADDESTADKLRRFESGEQADKGATSRDAAIGPWAREKQGEASAARGEGEGASDVNPGQHGGVRADDDSSDPQRLGRARSSGVKRGPSPADEPSSDRTGTSPSPAGGPSGRTRRTGKTGPDRHSPRG